MADQTPTQLIEKLLQWGVLKPMPSNEDRERRHLEMMAATIAAGYVLDQDTGGLPTKVAHFAVLAARAIQAEVAATEQGADNSELSAVCPVPPFPGIRGGGTDD